MIYSPDGLVRYNDSNAIVDDMPLLSQWIKKSTCRSKSIFWWERVDSDHRSQWQQIYSLPPLAARERSLFIQNHLDWSWWSESNQQPADYKSAALPLSHTSVSFWLAKIIITYPSPFVKRFLKKSLKRLIFLAKAYFFFLLLVQRPRSSSRKESISLNSR